MLQWICPLLFVFFQNLIQWFWSHSEVFCNFTYFLKKISPCLIIYHMTINSLSKKTFYAVDCLAGGLTSLLDSFHDVVDSFCVNFTLFCHMHVANSRFFQSWNLITCNFWCHAGFVSKVGQWKHTNDKDNMSGINCTKFHWLDSSYNRLA